MKKRMGRPKSYRGAAVLGCAGLGLFAAGLLSAQQRTAAPAAPPNAASVAAAPDTPASANAQAPFDLTGYWVSIVTQDWRVRMVVPGRGEYIGIPISLKGKQYADAWDPVAAEAAGRQCEAYGAAALMEIPERLHISWQDANTLKVETDSGMQTRLLRFKATPAAQPTSADAALAPSLQGDSTAQWLMHTPAAAEDEKAPRYGSLEVTTSHLLPGLLRKNGVPYSGQSRMTEYWEVNTDVTSGMQLLSITAELNDPEYLHAPYVHNPIFMKEADGSKWDPTPCSLKW